MVNSVITAASESGVPDYLVVLLGFGTVFIGLVCIVLMIELMHAIVGKAVKNKAPAEEAAPAAQPIENRQEIIAAVAAVLAEELGTDVSALRIHSFKKIN